MRKFFPSEAVGGGEGCGAILHASNALQGETKRNCRMIVLHYKISAMKSRAKNSRILTVICLHWTKRPEAVGSAARAGLGEK